MRDREAGYTPENYSPKQIKKPELQAFYCFFISLPTKQFIANLSCPYIHLVNDMENCCLYKCIQKISKMRKAKPMEAQIGSQSNKIRKFSSRNPLKVKRLPTACHVYLFHFFKYRFYINY